MCSCVVAYCVLGEYMAGRPGLLSLHRVEHLISSAYSARLDLGVGSFWDTYLEVKCEQEEVEVELGLKREEARK